MADKAYYLSESDVQTLKEMAHDYRTRGHKTRNKPEEPQSPKAPAVYIAKVPDSGIGARSGLVPGSALASIYWIDQDSSNTLTLLDTDQQTVWNLSTTAIASSAGYVKIVKDKGNAWIADTTSAASEIVVFELTDSLVPGVGYADAVICTLSGSVYVAGATAIVVFDWSNGASLWRGESGFRGIGRARSDGGYDILFMEMLDGLFEFTVYTDRNPSNDYITVTATGSYQQGGLGINFGSGAITLKDTQHLFDHALVGGKGVGFYDYFTNTYRVIQCQQQCITATALVDETGGTNTTGAVAIDTFHAASPSPFNLVPATAPTTAYNPFNHLAANNDLIWISWDQNSGHWIITSVLKKSRNVLSDVRQKSSNTQIEAEQAQEAVEYIDAPSYSDKIAIGTCP